MGLRLSLIISLRDKKGVKCRSHHSQISATSKQFSARLLATEWVITVP